MRLMFLSSLALIYAYSASGVCDTAALLLSPLPAKALPEGPLKCFGATSAKNSFFLKCKY